MQNFYNEESTNKYQRSNFSTLTENQYLNHLVDSSLWIDFLCYHLKIVLIEQVTQNIILRKVVINYYTVMADVRRIFEEPIKMIWELIKLIKRLLPVNNSRDD